MSDRIFGLIWLAVSITIGALAWRIHAPFSYEPVGPRAFPLLLAGLMAACSVWLMLRPGPPVRWPNRATFKRIVAMFVMLLAYALVFQWLGFMLATALLTIGIGRLFGGSWKLCVAGGVGMGISFYVLFDRLLDVVLPVGTLFK